MKEKPEKSPLIPWGEILFHIYDVGQEKRGGSYTRVEPRIKEGHSAPLKPSKK